MPEKRSNDYLSSYKEIREKILEQLDLANPHKAFSTIRTVIEYPGRVEDDSVWKDAFGLFERIISDLIGEELGRLVREIVEHPDDVQALYDASYKLYEQGLHGVAATLLSRANKILPQNEKIITELVSNFEAIMMNFEACNVLSDAEDLLESSELSRYLLGFNKVMTGRIGEAQRILPTIQNSTDSDIQFMAKKLEEMLERASILKEIRSLDGRDLRGWHAVLNGTILLHLSPFGMDAMNGRYSYVADSYSLCRHGIERLREVLKVAGIEIPFIFYLPYRSSRILALAASEILGKLAREWKENNYSEAGLIISYDLTEIQSTEILEELAIHRPGQVLWVHASCWTNPFEWFAPDVTTFLYQQNASPWGGGAMVYNRKTKKVEFIEPDKTPDEEISRQIVNAEEDKEYLNDLDDLLSMIKPLEEMNDDCKPGIFRMEGKRLRQRTGSPVLSNRF